MMKPNDSKTAIDVDNDLFGRGQAVRMRLNRKCREKKVKDEFAMDDYDDEVNDPTYDPKRQKRGKQVANCGADPSVAIRQANPRY